MIELIDLAGAYHRRVVVQEVSLRFSAARITAVVGPNGCGKSTLLKLCCGHLAQHSGEILVEGQALRQLSRRQIAQRISYMPQRRTTPDISAESLVLHGRFCWLGYPRVYGSADRQIARQAMQRLGIASLGERRLAELSGGEQQRVYLAMQLAQGARALLMDEPTTYLDIAHQLELFELLKGLRDEGKAVVMVLHDLDAALSIADQVVVMRGGRVLEAGRPEQVIASGAVDEAFAVRVIREERFSARLPIGHGAS